ncbi:MAG TPA: choice-of-anchor tandem repeat NxxGxxAF-containing protein [Phycisphaerae bacterium]|nr:choice-of-anchor tandem repeat NxxGxxAF-containing protein [Phycisphaerae bacterium]
MSRRSSIWIIAIPVLTMLAINAQSHAQVPVRTVALSGQSAPGTEAGVVFEEGTPFSPLGIDAAGRTAFLGFLTGSSIDESNDRGIWTESSGTLALLARKGDPAPGTDDGVVFSQFNEMQMNREARIVFESELTGPGVDEDNNQGIWSDGSGTLVLLARTGSPAPGTGDGVVFLDFRDVLINAENQVAFAGVLDGPGVDGVNREGVWSEVDGTLQLLVRGGDIAQGTGDDLFITFNFLAFNSAGQIVVSPSILGAGGENTGIWIGSDPLELVALAGDSTGAGGTPAPGVPDANFSDLFTPVDVDAEGRSAFVAEIAGAGVDVTNDTGIWAGTVDELALVAHEGDAAPNTDAGVNFDEFDRILGGTPRINAGRVAFHATLIGTDIDETNNEGIWSGEPGALALVARAGDEAPDTAGATFVGADLEPAINGTGQIAFNGLLTGAGVDFSNDGGIWIQDADASVRLIVREGDEVSAALGDVRTITTLGFSPASGGEGGRSTCLNDEGEIVFTAGFFDGTAGIFVTPGENLATECGLCAPGATMATMFMLPFLYGFRRRKWRCGPRNH